MALRLAQAIDVIVASRGVLFGLSLRVRLEILCARIQRSLGEFRGALARFDGAISIAEADQYAGWHEDTFLARVDQISIRTRLEGTAAEDLEEIERLRTGIRKAHEYHLIRSPA